MKKVKYKDRNREFEISSENDILTEAVLLEIFKEKQKESIWTNCWNYMKGFRFVLIILEWFKQ